MNFLNGMIVVFIVLVEVLVISCERARPSGMKQGIYCECCSATVKEISKKLAKRSSDPWDVRVLEAMEGVCKASSFRSYTYSPPTTVKACNYLMENYDEDMEKIFGNKETDPEKKICYELTQACEGVDRSKKEKEDMNVNINGQQQQPNDGINRMNVDINDPTAAERLAEQIKQQMATQPQTGGSEDDDEDEPEEGEVDDDNAENLLKGYDENGNEIKEEDLPDDEKEEANKADKASDGKKEKTEL